MDLMADQQTTLSLEWTDEMGNVVGAPDGSTATFSVSDPSIISLTDNGDGSAVAAATGTLGTADVHVDVSDGIRTLTGDLQIVVVPGLAERVQIAASEPTEVTPDV